jgi:hypothetical protein
MMFHDTLWAIPRERVITQAQLLTASVRVQIGPRGGLLPHRRTRVLG